MDFLPKYFHPLLDLFPECFEKSLILSVLVWKAVSAVDVPLQKRYPKKEYASNITERQTILHLCDSPQNKWKLNLNSFLHATCPCL